MDWTNPNEQITQHFTVADAAMLHAFNRLGTPADGMDPDKLITLCQKMEQIRALLGYAINVHCMYRSPAYNVKIGAPEHDVHSMSLACDFDCAPHLTIDQIHDILEPKLEEMGIRMERNTPTWVHIDLHPVMNQRYFYA
jgi:uncharacterized protein YcbK (DUF882 family)